MEEQLLKQLIEILKKEYQEYEKLLSLAEQKKESLIENDVDRLSNLIDTEEEVLTTISDYDNQRDKLVYTLSQELEIDHQEINYSELIDHIPEEWVKKLEPVRDKLLTIIDELHTINESNKMLIDEAIKLNNLTYKTIAQIVNPDNRNYNPDQDNKSDNSTTHIIDRKA